MGTVTVMTVSAGSWPDRRRPLPAAGECRQGEGGRRRRGDVSEKERQG
jgi:hypothetical protein